MKSVDSTSNKTESGAKAVCIVGTGSYLPECIRTNADLEKMIDTTDEWIRTRTGISQRHIARDDETTSDMAAVAATRAMESAGVSADQIDMIVVATLTSDMAIPSTACCVQRHIGAKNAFCFDISAACSGFIYSLQMVRHFITHGDVKTALVIGAEKLSCVTDWEDRSTCVLFGDGAGAAILQAGEGRGIIGSVMGSDGTLGDLLNLPAGGSKAPATHETVDARLHYLKMSGNEVFKHAVRCMCDAGNRALEKSGLTVDDVDCIIPHQANMRIIKAIASRLGNCMDKFYVNLDKVGNISAASVPVALDQAIQEGRLSKGDMLLLIAFGSGFTWGATVLEL